MSTHTQGTYRAGRPRKRGAGSWAKDSERMTAHAFLSTRRDKEKVKESSDLMGCSQGEVLRRGIDLAWRAAKREAGGSKPVAPTAEVGL